MGGDAVVAPADDPQPRAAPGVAEGAQLLDVGHVPAYAGLLLEPADRGRVEVLGRADEPAGQGEPTAVGVRVALDEQDREHALTDGQQHHVDGDREGRERRCVVPPQELPLVHT